MKIIEPIAFLMNYFDGEEVMKFLELCGRTAYQSAKNISNDSAEKFIRNIIKRGHESVLEHFSCTFKIICDRGVMAELTRHRLASFTIESTRFCDYSKDGLTFIKPCFWQNGYKNFNCSNHCSAEWAGMMISIENSYKYMLNEGATPQEARSILPNSLKTEIIMTANLREWRHILKLRTAKDAHPQMREVAKMILDALKRKLPVIFEDVGE